MSEIYEKVRRPPKTALREIQAGDLKGKTDINPQWRYEVMDNTFGLCGIGWRYEIVKLWDVSCQDGTVLAFSQINLYIKQGDAWSDPIPGIGGNTLVDMVKGYNQGDPKRPKPNDEGYKMATTDALSVALKMIGVGADIYMGLWDGTKYRDIGAGHGKDSEAQDLAVKLEEWLTVQPPIFSDENARKVRSCIAANDVENMKKWLAWAAKRNAEA